MIEQTMHERWNGCDAFDMCCDFCDHNENFNDMSFYQVIEEAKSYGWTMKKVDGDWEHKCPVCSQEKDE